MAPSHSLPDPKTPLSNIPSIVQRVRVGFLSGKTKSITWRRNQLLQIQKMLQEGYDEFKLALETDLGCKGDFFPTIELNSSHLKAALEDLEQWCKEEKVSTPLLNQPGSSKIMKEPFGVILNVAPWNYPVSLCINPMVAAIAAGNAVVIKPSEVTPTVSRTIARLIPKYLDNECVAVVEGGVEETQALLKEKFDYIFYTGNSHVGRIIMKAAAENLTPVLLELGGKSPCIVDKDADIDVTAKRILFGKFLNCGQTCIAPDYVLVHQEVESKLVDAIQLHLQEFFGLNPQCSTDYSRIVNRRHLERLINVLEKTLKNSDIQVVAGGKHDLNDRYLAPTVLQNVQFDSPIMESEIFGPILPIIRINSLEEAVNYINSKPKPLALYLFSKNKKHQDFILQNTSSGGACINDVVMHITVPELPFGGVGESGMGAYNCRHGFDSLTHHKSVLTRSFMMDNDIRYPPYTESKLNKLKKVRALDFTIKSKHWFALGAISIGLFAAFLSTPVGEPMLRYIKSATVGFLKSVVQRLDN